MRQEGSSFCSGLCREKKQNNFKEILSLFGSLISRNIEPIYKGRKFVASLILIKSNHDSTICAINLSFFYFSMCRLSLKLIFGEVIDFYFVKKIDFFS